MLLYALPLLENSCLYLCALFYLFRNFLDISAHNRTRCVHTHNGKGFLRGSRNHPCQPQEPRLIRKPLSCLQCEKYCQESICTEHTFYLSFQQRVFRANANERFGRRLFIRFAFRAFQKIANLLQRIHCSEMCI